MCGLGRRFQPADLIGLCDHGEGQFCILLQQALPVQRLHRIGDVIGDMQRVCVMAVFGAAHAKEFKRAAQNRIGVARHSFAVARRHVELIDQTAGGGGGDKGDGFATGGNPDAAELSGINTRMLTVKIFALMGFLCALSAVVASARLANHSNDIGTLDELRVIAAAVIGGTALSGGLGTIHGAILGALIMQALQSGMAMVGVDAPFQNIVVGSVLVLAVLIDIQYRKRLGAK